MNLDEFFLLGKVVKTSGSKGDLVFFLETGSPARYKKLESVFIKIHENLIPFFIDRIELKTKGQALVKLLDVDSPEEAEALLGLDIFLPLAMQSKAKTGRNQPDLTGFSVTDARYGPIGTVTDLLSMPMQELLSIDHNGKEILIPLVEEIIRGIDKKQRIIYIEAPEGLIELYL